MSRVGLSGGRSGLKHAATTKCIVQSVVQQLSFGNTTSPLPAARLPVASSLHPIALLLVQCGFLRSRHAGAAETCMKSTAFTGKPVSDASSNSRAIQSAMNSYSSPPPPPPPHAPPPDVPFSFSSPKTQAQAQAQAQAQSQPQYRRPSRSNSVSSSTVVTPGRRERERERGENRGGRGETIPDPSHPHNKATPPRERRRSSAAPVTGDAFGGLIANLNRGEHDTSSETTPTTATTATTPNRTQVNGAASSYITTTTNHNNNNNNTPNNNNSRNTTTTTGTHSPGYHPPASASASRPPQIPSIPSLPTLLPATVYDPTNITTNNSPHTASSADPPLTTPSFLTSPDYFSNRPRAQSIQRPPSRSKADRILGRSPLGSPPVALLESEARYRSGSVSRPAGHERSLSKELASRGRSESTSSSTTTATTRYDDSHLGTPPRTRERHEKDKKTMLSRALQKANTAVLLDNAQNFEGAVQAYGDACKLLQQVMIRSSGEEDRRKLDSIRVTYTNRIEELKRLDLGFQANGKSLPARPMSNESLEEGRSMLLDAADDDAVIQTASVTRIINDRSISDRPTGTEYQSAPSQQLPLRGSQSGGPRESVITTAIRDVQKGLTGATNFHLQPPPGRLANDAPALGTPGLESPMDRSYMPPPLSPRPSTSPLTSAKNTEAAASEESKRAHQRGNSTESISWLDTIDESGGSSCSSSVHSLSPGGMRRKHIRSASGATEAEFDAALDAAVEAAYDEGYEPYEDESTPDSAEIIAARLRSVELAKERVREAEREEAIAAAKYRYKGAQLRNESLPHVRESAEYKFQDEAEEEERLLDEMTREYMLEGFDFDLQTKSALPRQSDSSDFSGTTYNSSVSSHRTTAGTSLSTVAEVAHSTKLKAPMYSLPPVPPPTGPLPRVSEPPPPQTHDASQTTPKAPIVPKEASSVRSRRLSARDLKSLKIETSLPAVQPAPLTEKVTASEKDLRPDVAQAPKSAGAATFGSTQQLIDPNFKVPAIPQAHHSSNLRAPSPQPMLIPSPGDNSFAVSPATPALGHVISNENNLIPGSPKAGKNPAMGIRKNKSSLSLKQRTLSVSSPDGSDGSVSTPLSASFAYAGRKPSSSAIPTSTPSVPAFQIDGLPSGGMHLFESDIHSPYSPGSPSAAVTNAPIPLEPCPDSYLLRPFWLMRCFYQTIAHPRGGYLSTKLFIPRDVWRVKGVKLKYLDDKIANCDMLTAALQKLSSVDTLDADAVLEEMQALEIILDQVQTQLAKKLGNEVGVQGVSVLFKDAHTVGQGGAAETHSEKGSHGSQDHAPKSAMSQSKSYLSSWRKLRSKNSAVGLSNMAGPKHERSEVPKDSLTMATLPMTSLPNIRFAKRDTSNITLEGPNAAYMGSLAKLFDAAQILDQIARQVEDPGLKHSSPTHVGLELSARHAAEFFGFYICRFVLADVTLMLDKFIKRGSEWVLV